MDRRARHRKEPSLRPRDDEDSRGASLTADSIAVDLRRAREDRGCNLAQVAAHLKIRKVYLQAIEDGRFDDLPGVTYAVGFVRAYADYLELDGHEVVDRFKAEVDGLNEQLQLVFPTPVPESKMPSGALLLVSVLLVALAYGGWSSLSRNGGGLAGWIPEAPERLESSIADSPESEPAPAGTPLPQEETPAIPAIVDPEPDAGEAPSTVSAVAPEETPASSEAGGVRLGDVAAAVTASDPERAPGSPTPTTESLAPAASALASDAIPLAPSPEGFMAAAETREPRVYGAENGSARIVLRAVLDSWVQVRDAEQALLLTRVLQPGDSYRVPDLSGLTLLIGNAGGLQIEVDGAVLPPLGPVGKVRRDVALDPERLLNGTAVPQ